MLVRLLIQDHYINNMQAFYKEESKLGSPFIWLFILAGFIPFIGGFIIMMTSGELKSDVPYYVQIIILMILLVIFIIMLRVKLEFEIREGRLRYKMFPFNLQWQEIEVSDIESWSVRKINPIFYAGGWGYRRRLFQKKRAMITRGNKGLEMKLKNGKTVFLSTTQPEELEREMKKLTEA